MKKREETVTISKNVLAGLIVEILVMLFSVYNAVKLKINEYEAYWLKDFSLINIWVSINKEFW